MSDPGQRQTGKKTLISVLYVDDERDLLDITKLFLDRSGDFYVDTLTSAKEALDSGTITSYDVIVSDYEMPDLDGIGFLKQIRENYGEIPFILFTGRGREEVVIEAINYGADFYLQKGGDPRSQFVELMHKIRQAVRRRKAECLFRESEKRLADIINFLPDPTFAIDRSGVVIAWNRAMEDITGTIARDMLGTDAYALPFYGKKRPLLIDLISEPEDMVSRYYTDIIREGDANTAETDFIDREGKTHALLTKACYLYDDEGEITGAIESIRDITSHKKAESELLQQKAFTDSILEAIPGLLYVYDEAGHLIQWNKQSEFFTGYSADELRNMSYLDWFRNNPEDMDVMRSSMEITKLTGHGEVEANLQIKNGNRIPFHFSTVVQDFNDRRYYIGIGLDISDQKEVEAAILESTDRYRRFADNAPDMIFRLSLSDGRYEYVSPASLAITGYSPEEFYQSPFLVRDIIHPDWIGYFHERLQDLLEKKVSTYYEFQIIDRNGKTRWVNQRNVLILDDNGTPVAIEGIVTDFTAIKNAEEELRKSEQRLNAVTINAGSWIWEVDPDGMYRYSNSSVEKILGYRPEELVGKMHYYDLLEPSTREALTEAARHAFALHLPIKNLVNLNLHRDGRTIILSTSATPIYDQKGKFHGYYGIDEDITEWTRTHEALKLANKKLTMLSSITRHDILNKITAICGYLKLIEMDFDDPVLIQYVHHLYASIRTMKAQIEFTRVYQDLGTLEPRWLMLEDLMPGKDVPQEISFSVNVHGISVYADPMVEKVFFNLLENSLRHGEHVTTITVSASESDGILTIVWEDDGVGIAPEDKELIFARGYGKNTGLGMFLAREILSLTGITLSEVGVQGKGARFEIHVSKGGYHNG